MWSFFSGQLPERIVGGALHSRTRHRLALRTCIGARLARSQARPGLFDPLRSHRCHRFASSSRYREARKVVVIMTIQIDPFRFSPFWAHRDVPLFCKCGNR